VTFRIQSVDVAAGDVRCKIAFVRGPPHEPPMFVNRVALTVSSYPISETPLAEVIREMAKPRVAMSAREHCRVVRKEVLVVENNVEK
jgi:hypothetical protein